jgi:hypothetical protein
MNSRKSMGQSTENARTPHAGRLLEYLGAVALCDSSLRMHRGSAPPNSRSPWPRRRNSTSLLDARLRQPWCCLRLGRLPWPKGAALNNLVLDLPPECDSQNYESRAALCAAPIRRCARRCLLRAGSGVPCSRTQRFREVAFVEFACLGRDALNSTISWRRESASTLPSSRQDWPTYMHRWAQRLYSLVP